MINLEIPKKYKPLAQQANQVATEVFRPISRKYDEAEHAYPKELDMLASLIDGMNEGSDMGGAGAAGVRRSANGSDPGENRNGSNLSTVLGADVVTGRAAEDAGAVAGGRGRPADPVVRGGIGPAQLGDLDPVAAGIAEDVGRALVGVGA